MKNHKGAIYALKFSPNGKFLASGSFDKTVRIWDSSGRQQLVLDGHILNVVDIYFSSGSNSSITTASYDKTLKVFDLSSGKATSTFTTPAGFPQCVVSHQHHHYCGTTANSILLFDDRSGGGGSGSGNVRSGSGSGGDGVGAALVIRNASGGGSGGGGGGGGMINGIRFIDNVDGMNPTTATPTPITFTTTLVTADSNGYLRFWDIRADHQSCFHEICVAPNTCLSHVAVAAADSVKSIMAVNAYDDILRVYNISNNSINLLSELGGVKNRSWPIRSAIFNANINSSRRGRAATHDGTTSGEKKAATAFDGALLVATGSADGSALIYEIDPTATDAFTTITTVNSAPLFAQRLENAHADHVYDVAFHPSTCRLATAGGDGLIKLWMPSY